MKTTDVRSNLRARVALLLLLLPAAMLGCTKSSASESAKPDAARGPRIVKLDPGALARLGVKVEPAGAGAPSRSLRVPGTLDYNLERYGEVGTPLEGRIASINVHVGDRVKKGHVLGTIVVPSVASAQADYLTALASTDAAKKNRQREEELFGRQLTTAREAEVAKSEATKAEADLAAAEARLRALRVTIPKNDSVVAAAGALPLVAPIDGVVVQRDANLGQYLHPSDTAFTVADLTELWASLDVHESDVAYLKIGEEVDLVIDAAGGRTVRGRLQLVDPSLGRTTRAVRARVVVPNPDGSLRPGLFVRAQIRLPAEVTQRMIVPAAAVQPIGEEDVVFVERDPGAFEVRPIQVGARSVDIVEIANGLADGERIAVEGAFLLRGEVSRQ